MTQHNTLNGKLSNSKLNKLKSAIKSGNFLEGLMIKLVFLKIIINWYTSFKKLQSFCKWLIC